MTRDLINKKQVQLHLLAMTSAQERAVEAVEFNIRTPKVHHRLKGVVRPQLPRPGPPGQRILGGLVPSSPVPCFPGS